MMKKIQLPVVLLISTTLLVGCQTAGDKETVGTVVGAVAGGVIGSQVAGGAGHTAGAAFGALVGGLAGNAIGRSIDESDAMEAERAQKRARIAPVGDTIYWRNTRTGNWGTYGPIRDGHSRYQGYYCREFTATAYINGRIERVYSTACRHPNGTWYEY